MEAEQKRKKTRTIFWYPASKKNSFQSNVLGLVRETPWANFGGISVINSDQLWQQSFHVWYIYAKIHHLPDNRRLLPTPKETYDMNLSAITKFILSIWSFRTTTSIFGTKELYNPGLPPFFFAQPPSPLFSPAHRLLESARKLVVQAILGVSNQF